MVRAFQAISIVKKGRMVNMRPLKQPSTLVCMAVTVCLKVPLLKLAT